MKFYLEYAVVDSEPPPEASPEVEAPSETPEAAGKLS